MVLPEGLTRIEKQLFSSCSALERVVIPAGVTWVGEQAFEGCPSLTEVYYGGTAAQWQDVEIDEIGNWYLNKAEMYFYSEQEPPAGTDNTGYDGKYWRWADGRPLIWEK